MCRHPVATAPGTDLSCKRTNVSDNSATYCNVCGDACRGNRARSQKRSVMRRMTVRLGLAFLLIIVCAELSLAIPLAEYRERVRRAEGALESLAMIDEDEDEQAYALRRASTLRSVRQIIPPSETVEWNGTKIQVDNAWLDTALKDYEKLGADDPRRTDTLARITERLHALDERLNEIEAGKQEASAAEGKEADRRR